MSIEMIKFNNLPEKIPYLSFDNAQDAAKWGAGHYDQWAKQYKKTISLLTAKHPEYQDVIDQYCGYKHAEINDYLRSGRGVRPEICPDLFTLIHDLRIAIMSAPAIDQDMIVYRQVPMTVLKNLKPILPILDRVYTDPGFLSTSLHLDTCIATCGDSKIILKLLVPEGTTDVYVNSIRMRDELEMLLSTDTQLRLMGRPYTYKDCRIYPTQVIPEMAQIG